MADGELIVPRCDAPTLLDLVKEPPDEVAGAVEVRAEADRLPPIALWWNVGPCALLGHNPPDPVRIIAAICQQQGLRTKSAQESRAEAIVVRLTGGDAEHHRQAFAVHDSVDLGAEPTARPPHLLGPVAGDAGCVLLPQAHPVPAAVLVNELDAGCLQRAPNRQIVWRCEGGLKLGEFSTPDRAQAYG